jgi:hypothetical protein
MKRAFFAAMSLIVLVSCDEFTKPHEAAFTANGTAYTCGEDGVSAGYYDGTSNELQVTAIASGGEANSLAIIVDLNRLNETVAIDSAQEGFYFLWANSSIYYTVVAGQWEITSHEEGNPASRHTEGNFSFTAVNPYELTDTIRVTDGYFYVNNY